MTGLTTKRRSICAAPGHAIFEFTFMRINVASGTTLILKMEREHLVGRAARPKLVAFIARHCHVRACQREIRLAMIGNREGGAVKVLHGMATLTLVLIRCGLELPFMLIPVAVQTGREFHLVNSIFTYGNVAFCAIYRGVLAQQGVFRRGVLFHAEK
jgi:hypothetical protein